MSKGGRPPSERPSRFAKGAFGPPYGAALGTAGERTRARRELAEAAASFEARSAQPDLARALAKLGRRLRTNPATLTAKESAVARLVTEGLSNREAAACLVVSVKTVEYHLDHLYDKLGVRSRSQLVAKLKTELSS